MTIARFTGKSIAIALCGMALAVSLQAAAGLGPVVSQAYEVALSDFRAPGTASGTVAFSECAECDSRTIRVSGDTRYLINGKAVGFDAFRKSIAAVNDRDRVLVIVLHHLETDTVESISVTL